MGEGDDCMRNSFYDVALICLNRHVVNHSSNTYPLKNARFCKDCGAECINKCRYCSEYIRGRYHMKGVVMPSTYSAPSYCDNCGKPYPWLEEKLKVLDEMIDLMNELDELEKKDLKQSTIDITTDNPRTSLASLKIKRFGLKIGSEMYDALKKILVQMAVEAAKQQIGL